MQTDTYRYRVTDTDRYRQKQTDTDRYKVTYTDRLIDSRQIEH